MTAAIRPADRFTNRDPARGELRRPFRRAVRPPLTLVAVCALWGGPTASRAHPAYLTAAEMRVEPDGAFQVALRFDTLAFALNDTSARIGNEPMESLLVGSKGALEEQLAGARERLRRGFHVVTDRGEVTLGDVDFPSAENVLAWRDTVKPVLPVVIPARVSGHLPPGARTVSVRFPSVLEQVILTVERPTEEPSAEAVETGALSTALPVRVQVPVPGTKRVPPPPGGRTREAAHRPGSMLTRFAVLPSVLLLLGLISGSLWWRRKR